MSTTTSAVEQEQSEHYYIPPSDRNILHYLSFEANMPPSSLSSTRSSNTNPTRVPMQGVLWKRRDVFKSRWRPRWFALHPDRKILTYYLLTNQGGDGGVEQVTLSRFRNRSAPNTTGPASATTSLSSAAPAAARQVPRNSNHGVGTGNNGDNTSSFQQDAAWNRRRTFSETSNVSESTLDYDVIPRGTIYLLNATVEKNHALTRPEEDLFVLTITDKQDGIQCHLAARTEEGRDQWIHQIKIVCQSNSSSSRNNHRDHPRHDRQRFSDGNDAMGTANIQPQRRQQQTPTRQRQQESRSGDVLTPPRSNSNNNNNLRFRNMIPSTTECVPPGDPPSSMAVGPDSSPSRQQQHKQSRSLHDEWKTVPSPQHWERLPSGLEREIDDVLRRYLPYVDNEDHPDWKIRYRRNGIHCSAHKDRPIIRSIRRGTHHHPVEYLQVLWDSQQTDEYETNVKTQELLRKINPQTVLVHQSYHAVWPTSPRDFTVVAHWRLLQRDEDERALCLVTFSCQAADELKPVDHSHVRGTLVVGLHFWRLTNDGGGSNNGCSYTRIISYNLNGNIPGQITQAILEQQAALPRILDIHLGKKKKDPTHIVFDHQMDYQEIIQDLERMITLSSGSSSSKMLGDRSDSVIVSSRNDAANKSLGYRPPLEQDALLLLGPLMVLRLLSYFSIHLPAIVLPTVTFLAVRWLALRHLHALMHEIPSDHSASPKSLPKGTTCCRFTVGLKGLMRFLENEKEAKAQLGRSGSEVLLVHCIVAALAKSMGKSPHLISRHVPTLSHRFYSVDISIHDQKFTGGTKWIRNADNLSVQDVADLLHSNDDQTSEITFHEMILKETLGATCHVWTAADSNNSEVDMGVSIEGCPLTCYVSGVRMKKGQTSPLLCVSINILSTDALACRKFAEEVQKNLQFPEMLEG